MKIYNNQREIADLIIDLLRSSEINEIRLVGGLSENNFDNFSDITSTHVGLIISVTRLFDSAPQAIAKPLTL